MPKACVFSLVVLMLGEWPHLGCAEADNELFTCRLIRHSHPLSIWHLLDPPTSLYQQTRTTRTHTASSLQMFSLPLSVLCVYRQTPLHSRVVTGTKTCMWPTVSLWRCRSFITIIASSLSSTPHHITPSHCLAAVPHLAARLRVPPQTPAALPGHSTWPGGMEESVCRKALRGGNGTACTMWHSKTKQANRRHGLCICNQQLQYHIQ